MPRMIHTFNIEQLPIEVYSTNKELGLAAAEHAVELIKTAVETQGWANIVLATGNSQLTFYEALCCQNGLNWSQVRIFHMDEYAGMKPDHPASFRGYLLTKLVNIVKPAEFYGITGETPDLQSECNRYSALLKEYPIDLCCLGIGENGHLAFNDPPFADFNDPSWVKIVKLAEASRRQQVGEGHFLTLADVPTEAITMTIPALLAAKALLCIVPEARKAKAVRKALTGPIVEDCPASILRKTKYCRLLLDVESASQVMELQ